MQNSTQKFRWQWAAGIALQLAAMAVLLTGLLATGARADAGSQSLVPASYIGLVVQVHDGDRLQLMLGNGKLFDIKLAAIEAPTAGERFARESRNWLRRQLQRQLVAVDCGRALSDADTNRCFIYPDHRDINYFAVRYGYARVDQSDVQRRELAWLIDPKRYHNAESIAQREQRGLWAMARVSP